MKRAFEHPSELVALLAVALPLLPSEQLQVLLVEAIGVASPHGLHLLGGEGGEAQLGQRPRQLQAHGDSALLRVVIADAMYVLHGLPDQRQEDVVENGLFAAVSVLSVPEKVGGLLAVGVWNGLHLLPSMMAAHRLVKTQ